MKFDRAKPETQAIKAISRIQKAGLISSCGTYRNYQYALESATRYVQEHRLGDLRQITVSTCIEYLNSKVQEFGQKTLDMHRQALQAHLHATGALPKNETLDVIKASRQPSNSHRAYTPQQVQAVADHQRPAFALATQIAYSAGLRAHELLTLRPLSERPADIRRYEDGSVKSLESKWHGREEGVPYSVVGKGGLVREVRIPETLSRQLEARRLSQPVQVQDRTIFYQQHYDLPGGQRWSNSFSAASSRALGWSTGAHGLRHSYAQERLSELQKTCPYERALETVSQEMGHFRPEITETYLR